MSDSELIAQFCAITGSDTKMAESYLSVNENNLEQALSLFFESGGVSLESQHASSTAANRNSSDSPTPGISSGNQDEDEDAYVRRLQEQEYGAVGGAAPADSGVGPDGVRERIQPVRERLVDPGFDFPANLQADPFSSLRSRLGIFNQRSPLGSTSSIFRGSVRNMRGDDDDDDDNGEEDDDDDDIYEDAEANEVRIDDEDDDDSDIVELTTGNSRLSAHQSRLANLFRPPFDLITNLLLDPAKERAIRKKKWLLVNIQDNHEFQCQILNRDLWSNSEVKTVVKSNFVFVQYPHDSSAGQEYIQYYPFQEYPHIAILDPRTGEQLRVWNAISTPNEWLMEVYDFLGEFSLEPGHRNPLAKIAKRKQVDHMTEEEQIELAMKQSLGQEDRDNDTDDIEIVDAKNVPSSSTASASASASLQKKSEESKESEELTEDEVFATILPAADTEEPQDPGTSTRIQIRLGTGQRIIRRFLLQDKVSHIFAIIKAVVPDVKNHYFILTTSDRRNLIGLIDQTVQEAGLQNSAILLEIMD